MVKETISSTEILELLRQLTKYSGDETDYVEEAVVNPLGRWDLSWRYYVTDEGEISVQLFKDGEASREAETISLRQFIWNMLRLDKVCDVYYKAYEAWEKENDGIPYIQTQIAGEEKDRMMEDYVHDFCRTKNQPGLRLLMAEYGMGKSSFCCGIRRWASDKKDDFLKGDIAFPIVFDLNKYRNLEFGEFIQNCLIVNYGLSISYEAFLRLCQWGVFYVVLDAWDQMHHTLSASLSRQDINQFSELWKREGKVLITCRRSFYQQQIHNKSGDIFHIPTVKIYTLQGFELNSIKQYFKEAVSKNSICKDNIEEWIEKCWSCNKRLLERPLNIKLLSKHFAAIDGAYRLDMQEVDTYQFLDCILYEWEKDKYSFKADAVLKLMVKHSLETGMNRSFPKEEFVQDLKSRNMNPHAIMSALNELDFVDMDNDSFVQRIEFKLAAYQEFLWAHYAIEELDRPKVFDNDTLLKLFKLNPEVRAWMVGRLIGEDNNKSELLEERLKAVRYKFFAEVKYSGSNALTLLRDLSREEGYGERISTIIKDLKYLPLDGVDLRGMDLTGANFENSSLIKADLSYTKLNYASFKYANLTDVEMNEYGHLSKCSFISWDKDRIVASSTESGGILTFNIGTRASETFDLYQDKICGITADSGGVYTAWKDGWVSFLSSKGQLKTAYLASGGLESIASGNQARSVYVGSNLEGLFRYDWRLGTASEIKIMKEGMAQSAAKASNVHYARVDYSEYVAYVQNENKLVLIELEPGGDKGEIVGTGMLEQNGMEFGDICFVGDRIAYSVAGKGVFIKPIGSMIGDVDENYMIDDHYSVFSCRLPVEIAWADSAKKLFIVEKTIGQLDHICSVSLYRDEWKLQEIDLYREFRSHAYELYANNIDGMCVSADGRYIAIAGDKLAVFKTDYKYADAYCLACELIEAKIGCEGADFRYCDGLSDSLRTRLRKGDAVA